MLPVPLMFDIPFTKCEEIGGRLLFTGMNAIRWAHEMNPLVLPGKDLTESMRISTYTKVKQTIGFILRDVDLQLISNMGTYEAEECAEVLERDPRLEVRFNCNGQRSVIRWKTPSE